MDRCKKSFKFFVLQNGAPSILATSVLAPLRRQMENGTGAGTGAASHLWALARGVCGCLTSLIKLIKRRAAAASEYASASFPI